MELRKPNIIYFFIHPRLVPIRTCVPHGVVAHVGHFYHQRFHFLIVFNSNFAEPRRRRGLLVLLIS